MNIRDILLTIAGFYNIVMSLILNTKNLRSALIFKVIPFFLGLSCLYVVWVLK
jgi:hypothetical protein